MTQTIKPTILFKRPDSIPGTVEFLLPTGETAKLACQFKYRTRPEYGAFVDEIAAQTVEKAKAQFQPDEAKTDAAKPRTRAKAKANADAAEAPAFSLEALLKTGDESNADSVLKYLVSWPEQLPPLNKENLMQVFGEAPAAAGAFWETYRNLCTVGRMGN